MRRSSSSLGVDAAPDVAAFARERRRLVDERVLDGLPHLHHFVEFRRQARHEGRLEPREQLAESGHGRERRAERHQVARPGGAERGARHEALDVVHRPQRIAELAPLGRAEGEVLDGIEAVADALEREERPDEPRAEEARAHGRHGAVKLLEQRAGAGAVHRLDDLEVLERQRIDDESIGVLLERDAAQVREVRLLRVLQVVDQRAGRPDGRRMAFEAEPLERLRAQLIEQRPSRAVGVKRPGVHRRHAGRSARGGGQQRVDREIGRHEDLAWPQDRHLVPERPQAVAAPILSRQELTGRQVEQRDADGRLSGGVGAASLRPPDRRDGHQERGFAGIEIPALGEGARTDDPHHFAAHQASRFARVLHLLADGDAEALLDEAGDVGFRGVIGHAAHGDAPAVGVLAARGECQLEGAGGHQRVLVKHLVEVAHPEEDDGVAILALCLEVLAHRRRGVRQGLRGGGSVGGRHDSEYSITPSLWGTISACSCWRSTPRPGKAA